MLSFHNEQQVKDKYLDRVRKHREMDNIIQGTGWENGKGCAVGCTLENYDHTKYPVELGLPEWLAHLEDRIFENLPLEEAKVWPERFLSAIPVGVDTEIVKHKIAIRRLDNLIEIQNKLLTEQPDLKDIFLQTITAINSIKICHESEINKTQCDWSAAESAWSAWSAIWSAAESARSAEESAWSVAESAWSAARSAAWSAAWSVAESAGSAWSAIWSAAWSVPWKKEADILIEELEALAR